MEQNQQAILIRGLLLLNPALCFDDHETVNHGTGEYVRGSVHTNTIESTWPVFKRSITGTWHHVSRKHLSRYVDEATFRLNQGNCEVDTIDRMETVIARIGGKRIAYKDLVA